MQNVRSQNERNRLHLGRVASTIYEYLIIAAGIERDFGIHSVVPNLGTRTNPANIDIVTTICKSVKDIGSKQIYKLSKADALPLYPLSCDVDI